MDDPERLEEAKRRVAELRGFYIHLLIYTLVNIGLFFIDLAAGDDTWWFYWPAIGWGIGVAAHGVAVATQRGFLGPEWERRKIREYLDRGP